MTIHMIRAAHQFFLMLLILVTFYSSTGWAEVPKISEEQYAKVAESKHWHHLLHYRKDWWWGVRSEIDGPGFFFAEDGAVNPLAELKASVAAMNKDLVLGKLKLHPQCAFPERYRFLKEKFNLNYPEKKCEKLEFFYSQFRDPTSISLVFSSAYPNNPASMFGHTFFKINAAEGSDLNNQGLNFAANVPEDDNGLVFVWKGTTGGYLGQWSYQPYYVKLNEYVNFENRDVWEYELSLTKEETRRLLAHVWEIETNSYMEYYFFDENCSYQIFTLIAAVRPEWDQILDHRVYVIPGETVKQMVDVPGAIKSIKFRPSHYKKMMQRVSQLNSVEEKDFFAVIEHKKKATELDSRFVLDAVASYYDYVRNEEKGKYKDKYEELRKELLIHRATLGQPTPDELARLPEIQATTQPELGHDPYSISLGGGQRVNDQMNDTQFGFLRMRSSYHDLLSNDVGYSRYSHIDSPWVEFQYEEEGSEFRLETLQAMAITSLHPISPINSAFSFKVNLGIQTVRDYGCTDCRHIVFEGGLGYSFKIFHDWNIAYVLGQIRADAYSDLGRGYRYGPGIDAGLIFNPVEPYKIQFGVVRQWDVDQKDRADQFTIFRVAHSYSMAKNWEIRNVNQWLESERGHQDWSYNEYKLEIRHFFR